MKPETLSAYAALADAMMKDDSCNPTMVIAKIPGHVIHVQCGPSDEEGWTLTNDEILSRWARPAFLALKQKIASIHEQDAKRQQAAAAEQPPQGAGA